MSSAKKRTFLMILICIFWIAVIFLFSAMNSNTSSDLTNSTLEAISYFRDNFVFIDEIFIKLTENHSIFYIVRKLAHLFVFCVLQVITFTFLRTIKFSFTKSSIYSILFVIAYACTDEFHQLFVDGRSGQLSDVFIDTLGGFIGLFFVLCSTLFLSTIKRVIFHVKRINRKETN